MKKPAKATSFRSRKGTRYNRHLWLHLLDFVYDVEEMPQSSQPLLAEGFRMEAGGKGKN
jgi:hypothetical protein